MCRTGGRRCETHWTKAQKDADNARRRAAYAARKSSTAGSSNIISTPNSFSATADQFCYAPETLRGHIDVATLNDTSYSDYGFSDPRTTYSEVEDMKNTRKLTAENSRTESADFSYEERMAMSLYTDDYYEQINKFFFESSNEPFHPDGDPPSSKFNMRVHHMASSLEKEELHRQNKRSFGERVEEVVKDSGWHTNQAIVRSLMVRADGYAYTEHAMREYTEHMDNAFTKASGEQRITYRGETFGSPDSHHRTILPLKEYIAQTYPLGGKKQMKGVQSTSASKATAQEFSGSKGIIYEIRSASGVNITDLAYNPQETEVLLPRNSQYIIVGSKIVTPGNGTQLAIVQMVEVDENNSIRTKDNLRTEFGEINYERLRPKKEGD